MSKSIGFSVVGLIVVGAVVFGSTDTNKTTTPVRNKIEIVLPKNATKLEGIAPQVDLFSYSGDKRANSDGFNLQAETALKYIKVDYNQAACMCDTVDYKSVINTIERLKSILEKHESAYLLIDSPGGSVFDGAMLVSYIKGSKKPIYTVAVGMAASMGAQILSVGHKRYATDNAVLMWHPPAGGLRGTVPEMDSLLNFIKRYTEKWDKETAARAGIPYEKFEVMVLKNLWLMADEAKALNLIDDVVYID